MIPACWLSVDLTVFNSAGSKVQKGENLYRSDGPAGSLSQPRAKPSLPLPTRDALALCLLVGGALALRVLSLLGRNFVIEMEGAPHTRAGENVANDAGYFSTIFGWELVFQPLYPCLIALASFLPGSDIEFKARLVSLLLQTAMVLPIFLLTRMLHGITAAVLSGALIAIHPLLVVAAPSVLTAPTCLTLYFTGLYGAALTVETGGVRARVLAGVAFGLAYLTRPEGIVLAAAAGGHGLGGAGGRPSWTGPARRPARRSARRAARRFCSRREHAPRRRPGNRLALASYRQIRALRQECPARHSPPQHRAGDALSSMDPTPSIKILTRLHPS